MNDATLLAQITARASGSHLALGSGPKHTIDPKIQTLDLPAYSSASFSTMGASILQGPHHSAQ